MVKLEVLPDSLRSITSHKSGKSYRVQTCYVHVLDANGKPQPHPVRAEFFVGDKDTPPAPGQYILAPSSIYVDRAGRLAIAPKLVPAPAR